MSLRTGLLIAGIVGAVALAYQLGTRLSDQAVDVAVGVLCGILASVPVSLGLLLALTRQRREKEELDEPDVYSPRTSYAQPMPRQPPYPPVIVVTPPQSQLPNPYGNLLPPGTLPPGYMNEPPASRDFRIIGEDDDAFDA